MSSFEEIHDKIKSRSYIEAESLLAKSIHQEPDNSDLYYLRGLLKSYQNKVSSSIEDLKHSLKLDPRHTDAAVCLSIILNDIGHYDEAKKYFEQANQSVFLKQAGDDAQIDHKFSIKHFELGDLYFRHRRFN
jgi:tetratricopeptide (TPR) repeat protein